MKRKTRKKRGPTIDEIREELLLSPEKILEQIQFEEEEKSFPKRPADEIEIRGISEEDHINQMDRDEMNDLLLGLKDSKIWYAYKKYTRIRLEKADEALRTLDPVTQATEIARTQGIRMGLLDVEGYILSLDGIRNSIDSGN